MKRAGSAFQDLSCSRHRTPIKRILCGSALSTVLVLQNVSAVFSATPPESDVRHFQVRIDATTVEEGLRYIQRNMGIDVIFSPDQVRRKRTQAVSGDFTPQQAIERLLAGTGLQAKPNGPSQYIIVEIQAPADTPPVPVKRASSAPQQQQSLGMPDAVEEVVITGSRIVREGYESPTPLTVIGVDALTGNADANLLSALATAPVISGVSTLTNSTDLNARGGLGVQSLNLRSLGTNRVLVLMDGERFVPATVTNAIDVGAFPTQLLQRVDVVTGGASAVYGSDAVAGVVNFVLDRKFTGVKGEISGGVTHYGDNRNYRADLSAGFGFTDDRGHVLLSGSQMYSSGIQSDGGREWNYAGYNQITNPNYTPTNGQPFYLVLPQTAAATQTAGGLIVTPGPLKGVAFGPGGTPYKFNYGTLFAAPVMTGGDWAANNMQHDQDLAPSQSSQNLFARVSYDLADDINVFAQYLFSQTHTDQQLFYNWMPGAATGAAAILIQQDNAFLPASVRTAMAASGITNFSIGTWNADTPGGGGRGDTRRLVTDITTGFEGNFDALGTNWKWKVDYTYGSTKFTLRGNEPINTRYRQAVDAIVNPATGQIVCRLALTDPATACRPWNAMGIGVNTGNDAAWNWITGATDTPNGERGLIEMQSIKASVTGELGATWAGPISEAVSFEHTHNRINALADPISAAAGRIYSNFASLNGASSVTEGALEAVVPLAKDESWARSWDLTAAVRFTGYQYAGYVTTWKLGTTYAATDSIELRITRSRDIRAPTIIDNFSAGQSTQNNILDRFTNSTYNMVQFIGGNTGLAPEKADTTGVGVVLRPSFLEGFTASVDYWNIDIGGAISSLTSQNVIDLCYTGAREDLCANIIRDSAGMISTINVIPINLAVQQVRGLDLEASYRTAMQSMVPEWRGDFSLHGNMTIFLKAYQDTTITPPTQTAGQASGIYAVPSWKMTATATYMLDPITVSVTGRAISGLKYDNSYVECAAGCPAFTSFAPTINRNHIAGVFYLDATAQYALEFGDATKASIFVSAKNLLNRGVPLISGGASGYYQVMGHTTNAGYDYFGALYRAGIRFRM